MTGKAASKKSSARLAPNPRQAACRKAILEQLRREQLARTGKPFRESGATGRGVVEFANACDNDPAEAEALISKALAHGQDNAFWLGVALNPLKLASSVNELRALPATPGGKHQRRPLPERDAYASDPSDLPPQPHQETARG